MKNTLITASALALAAPLAWAQSAAGPSSAPSGGMLVYGTAGTSGAGAGIGTQVNDKINVRAEVTGYNATLNEANEDLKVQGKLKLESAGLYADYFPFASTFRVTGGLMLRAPNGKVTAAPATGITATIGNVAYTFGAADALAGTIKYPSTMGYLGVGWGLGMLKDKGVKFGFDLGAGFGSLKSSLVASNSLKANVANAGKDISADLAAEERKLNDKLNRVSFFPVVKLSIGYSF